MLTEAKYYTRKTIRELVTEDNHRCEVKKLKDKIIELEDEIDRWKDVSIRATTIRRYMLERGGDPAILDSEYVIEIERLKDVIRKIFHKAIDREMCDSIARGFALAAIAGTCQEAIGPWCEKCEKIGCNCKNA